MAYFGDSPVRSVDCPEIWRCRFTTDGLSTPTVFYQSPSAGGVTLARTGPGTYTLTFPTNARPSEALPLICSVLGAEDALELRPVSFAGGVFTFQVYARLGNTAPSLVEEATVTSDEHESADPGFIASVTATEVDEGGSAGEKAIVDAAPEPGEVAVAYTEGVGTLTFNADDAVLECSFVLAPPAETAVAPADTTGKVINIALLLL